MKRMNISWMAAWRYAVIEKYVKRKDVLYLDFSNDISRRKFIKYGLFQASRYARDPTSFKQKLADQSGIDLYELENNIDDIAIITPAQLMIGTVGVFLSIESKFSEKILIKNEAYYRMRDMLDTLLSMLIDLDEFGIGSLQSKQINRLLAEILNPTFSCQNLTPKSSVLSEMKEQLMKHPITHDLIQHCNAPLFPIFNEYKKYRNGSNSSLSATQPPYQRVKNGAGVPQYHSSGACLHYNLYLVHAKNRPPCGITSKPHKKTHFCVLCKDPNHPLMLCPWIRGTLTKRDEIIRDLSTVDVSYEKDWTWIPPKKKKDKKDTKKGKEPKKQQNNNNKK